MKKQRKRYSPEEKVAILRRHLLEKEPISKLCDELGLQPTVFYRWQKEFFENGTAAFEERRPSNHSADQERITPKDMLAGRQQGIHAERDGSWRRHGNNGRFVASKPLDASIRALLGVGYGSSTSGLRTSREVSTLQSRPTFP